MSEFRRGDCVFVYPTEGRAPREVRGLSGTVKKVRGDRAVVVWHHDENVFSFEVDPSFLQRERRRRHRPAEWTGHELAAAS